MKRIDEQRLENDLAYRFQYLQEFIGFGPEDVRSTATRAKPPAAWKNSRKTMPKSASARNTCSGT